MVDPYDLETCEKAVLEELAAPEPSVIISRRPCVLLKYVKPKAPIAVKEDKCVGCRQCMKLGCPAISVKDKRAEGDCTQGVGCNVCAQLCKVGAMEQKEV